MLGEIGQSQYRCYVISPGQGIRGSRALRKNGGCQALEGKGGGELFDSIEFQLCKMERFWRAAAQQCECT